MIEAIYFIYGHENAARKVLVKRDGDKFEQVFVPCICTDTPFWVRIIFSDCLPIPNPAGYYGGRLYWNARFEVPGNPPFELSGDIGWSPGHQREGKTFGPFEAKESGSGTLVLWGTLERRWGFPVPWPWEWGTETIDFTGDKRLEFVLCQAVEPEEAPPPSTEVPGPYPAPPPSSPPQVPPEPAPIEDPSEPDLTPLIALPLLFIPVGMMLKKEEKK